MFSATSNAAVLPVGYALDEARQVGRRQFLRARSTDVQTSGTRSFLCADSGLAISTADIRHDDAVVETVVGAGLLKVHVRLSGASRIGHEDEEGLRVGAMSCGALIHPAGETKVERYEAAVHERSVTVACSCGFLNDEFGIESGLLPRAMGRFVEGQRPDLWGFEVPMLLETRQAAEVLFEEMASGATRALMIEARALELLARFLDQARALEGKPEPAPLPPRDRRIADSARIVLEERLSAPPCLKSLAHEVGTHPAKLMRLFKAAHGRTISDYIETLRMARARAMLGDGGLSVTQIAYELGYEHPGNFATAFKRHFGRTPSQVRSEQRPVAASQGS